VNEVKDICDRMLADPPPVRDSGEVLATARRSAVRRRRAGLASAGMAAVVFAALALPLTVRSGRTVESPAPRAAAPPAVSEVPKELPPARAAFAHSAEMRRLLLAAIPAGYTTEDYPVGFDRGFDQNAVLPNDKYRAPEGALLNVAFAGLLVHAGGGEGMLTASIWASRTIARACATNPGETCEVVTVDGVDIEVSTWQDESGRHIGARRPLNGGWLSVIASQGMGGGDRQAPLDGAKNQHPTVKPPLATLPVTEQQLVALAANPAMLQFP
jgi:hypothetical protein